MLDVHRLTVVPFDFFAQGSFWYVFSEDDFWEGSCSGDGCFVLRKPHLECLLRLCACDLAGLLVEQAGQREVHCEALVAAPDSWAGLAHAQGAEAGPLWAASWSHSVLAFSFVLSPVRGRSLSPSCPP